MQLNESKHAVLATYLNMIFRRNFGFFPSRAGQIMVSQTDAPIQDVKSLVTQRQGVIVIVISFLQKI